MIRWFSGNVSAVAETLKFRSALEIAVLRPSMRFAPMATGSTDTGTYGLPSTLIRNEPDWPAGIALVMAAWKSGVRRDQSRHGIAREGQLRKRDTLFTSPPGGAALSRFDC